MKQKYHLVELDPEAVFTASVKQFLVSDSVESRVVEATDAIQAIRTAEYLSHYERVSQYYSPDYALEVWVNTENGIKFELEAHRLSEPEPVSAGSVQKSQTEYQKALTEKDRRYQSWAREVYSDSPNWGKARSLWTEYSEAKAVVDSLYSVELCF